MCLTTGDYDISGRILNFSAPINISGMYSDYFQLNDSVLTIKTYCDVFGQHS